MSQSVLRGALVRACGAPGNQNRRLPARAVCERLEAAVAAGEPHVGLEGFADRPKHVDVSGFGGSRHG
jgi:hypothetical protein